MRQKWREILVALAILVGWLLIVWGIASLTTIWVWPIGIGILLLSLTGFKLLWVIMTVGMYTLSRAEPDESD